LSNRTFSTTISVVKILSTHLKLHLQVFGSGKPIVLIHGWAMHSGIWRAFAQRLAQQHRVICVDLPGHGLSPVIELFTLDSISQALDNTLGDEPAVWLGWSLGATVALDYARRYPERVQGLLLMCGNPCFTKLDDWPAMDANVLEQFAGQLHNNSQATLLRFLALQVFDLDNYKSLLSELKETVFECPAPNASTLTGGLDILKQTDLRAVLSALTLPTAALFGTRDALVPVAVGEAMQQLLPTLQVQVLDKAGHIPFLSHPAAVLKIVGDFMDSPAC
jgi:pimeloyl-[acyl-carrier protein] methyl ester esterase